MEFPKSRIKKWISKHRETLLENYKTILKVPAISPDFDGEGEYDKFQVILSLLKAWGWEADLKIFNAPDPRAKKNIRPNLIITHNPQNLTTPTLCIVSHIDVVPTGDESLWTYSPFDPTVKDGKLYGRGTEDNGQGLIVSLYALKCIRELKLHIEYPIKIVLVSDEECGSKYGIQFLIEQNEFSSEDLVLVPDSGIHSGKQIQIAEKTGLWVKIVVTGIQGHASRPEDGLNAHRIANQLAVKLDGKLHSQFAEQDERFESPVSTFEPTKRVNTVENVNTLPGKDELYWDCRLIPAHSLEEVKKTFQLVTAEFAQKYGTSIVIEYLVEGHCNVPIPETAPAVQKLKKSINRILGGPINIIGLGGGSCAAHFRTKNIPAVVWGHMDHLAHQIDEYCVIENIFEDILVNISFLCEYD